MPAPLLTFERGELRRDGAPHRILAGAIHSFRVHPSDWRDRIRRLAAMGANTLDTYIAWNAHQPQQNSAPDFSGWNDIGRFIDIAGEEGLDVIVRPGPYICAEWDNGALPSWLDGAVLRTRDPGYRQAVETWFDALLPHIVDRQAANGGPVIAVQVENEYGSFGDDHAYMKWHHDILLERGVVERLFTADGGNDFYLDGGALPDVWAAATLGSRGDASIETWRRRRPGEPFFAVEFWGGWFDHWGEDHHVRSADDAAAEVAKILDRGGSVCIYMAHGGTNFGLRSGANFDGGLQPTVTSYDSDAPIAEDGALTAKFHALRQEFYRARGETPPALPDELAAPLPVLPAQTLPVRGAKTVLDAVGSRDAIEHPRPQPFSALGADTGFVLYEADPVLPLAEAGEETRLRILGLADRAQIWVDGEYLGVLDEHDGATGVPVAGAGRPARVQILVENLGRINYGPEFGADKGILHGVCVNQRLTTGWRHTVIDPASWGEPELRELASAEFEVDVPASTHLAFPGFVKGLAWINGFLLGRYWERGPQETLYVPAGLIHAGRNEVRILELERFGTAVQLHESPRLGGPGPGDRQDG